jgi:hypothetical protein
VVEKVRRRLSVSKQAVQTFDLERFNSKELNDMEAKEVIRLKYQICIQL